MKYNPLLFLGKFISDSITEINIDSNIYVEQDSEETGTGIEKKLMIRNNGIVEKNDAIGIDCDILPFTIELVNTATDNPFELIDSIYKAIDEKSSFTIGYQGEVLNVFVIEATTPTNTSVVDGRGVEGFKIEGTMQYYRN